MITKSDIVNFLSSETSQTDFTKLIEDEDGWLTVFIGEEDGRRHKNKKIRAFTFVQLYLKSKDDVLKCLKSLYNSNIRIQQLEPKPDFDRRRIKLKDNSIRFTIAWYNIDFFLAKKEMWKNNTHSSIFKSFNVSLEDFIVEHIIL